MRVVSLMLPFQVVALMTSSVKTEFFKHKEGGINVKLPPHSAYLPIRERVETMMSGSLSGARGHDRHRVARSTVAVLLRRYRSLPLYIRRGWGATKLFLLHMLFPIWLIDRWARQSGGLDKLRKAVRAK